MHAADSQAARQETARAWARALRSTFQTVILGTTSPDAQPDASVAGAVLSADGSFYIYVSGLAAHTRNLRATGRASVLLIEDEATAAQPLARRRLTFACAAASVARGTAEHATALGALQARLGAAFDLVAGLGDFELFRLTPETGRLVAGFGQAYTLNPRDWSELSAPLGPGRNRPPTSPGA